MAAGDGLWAIGDVTGLWPLTYVGKHQARIAAANILGRAAGGGLRRRPARRLQRPAGRGGRRPPRASGPPRSPLSAVPGLATYTRAFAEHPGFLTLVADGERLTGAYALGPEAGEWLQQATLAIRARVPLDVLRDTIQPFPTFSEAFVDALAALGARVPTAA